MHDDRGPRRLAWTGCKCCFWLTVSLSILLMAGMVLTPRVSAGDRCCHSGLFGSLFSKAPCVSTGEMDGAWYWMRSNEQEKRVVAALFNRYCIRCHGVDGRGVWDIPDVPNFTNPRWQACRSDSRLSEIILGGRGAVMPPFRGTLSLEEACAMAHYLRTFIPGAEVGPPDYGEPAKTSSARDSTPAKNASLPSQTTPR